jgi:DNA-binding NarL/FixJ family response regulator
MAGEGGLRHALMKRRVAIVSGRPLVASGLVSLFESQERFVAIPCADAECGGSVDVALVEAVDAVEARVVADRVVAAWPGIPFVLLVRHLEDWCHGVVRDVGAAGFITCDSGAMELGRALEDACAGRRLQPPQARTDARRQLSSEQIGVAQLTGRESEVLRRLASGHAAEGIARDLAISPNTVRTHVQNLMLKLGVHSRVEAVAVARRSGMLGTLPA